MKNNSGTALESSDNALDMNEVKASLPEEKRPKYVSILQDKGKPMTTPLPASSTPTETPNPANKGKKTPRNGKFGNKNYKNVPQNEKRRVFLPRQEVVALPADLETRDMQISHENVLFFNGAGHFMSALYPSKLVIDGNEYNSVEHYYQACKLYTLIGKDTAAELRVATTPLEVKKLTKTILKGKVTPKAVAEWKAKDSIIVLKHAITQKFAQNVDLKKSLLETGNKILIQTYIGDSLYAVGANAKYTSGWVGLHLNQSLKIPVELIPENVKYLPLIVKGKNVLGWILMQVREDLRSQ